MFQAAVRSCRRGRWLRRRGLTLIEIMVAITLSLLVIAALAEAFKMIGDGVTHARANINLSIHLRNVGQRLQKDLEGLTAPVRPWNSSSSGLGYFEYIERAATDKSNAATDSIVGDFDDVLMFTVRSTGAPFIGRVWEGLVIPSSATPLNPYTIESQVAEIIWWTELRDENGNGVWDKDELFVLHRRVLLIRPDLATATGNNQAQVLNFFNNNDLSARRVGNTLYPNSLADLTLRQNRFAHGQGYTPTSVNFPFAIEAVLLQTGYLQSGTYQGEDVMQAHILGFDVQAYDPTAWIKVNNFGTASTYDDEALIPSDPNYSALAVAPDGYGCYVDLNYNSALTPASTYFFAGGPQTKSLLTIPTYDTWALDYERDGVDQDGSLGVDQGTNGLDDDAKNGVDDEGERETLPPYPAPLRGIRVRIRMLDRETQQMRQVTIVSNFVPE